MRRVYEDICKKIELQNLNCGVKIRNKEESKNVLRERIEELRINGKSESKECKFLLSILKASE